MHSKVDFSDSLQTATMSMSFEYRFSVMRNAILSSKSFLFVITFNPNAFTEDLLVAHCVEYCNCT